MLQSLIKSITVYLLWTAQDTIDSESVAEQQRFARLQKLCEARYVTKNGLLLPYIRSLFSLMHAYDASVRRGHSERGNELGQWRLTPHFVLEGFAGYHRGSCPFDRQQALKSPLYSVFNIVNVVGAFLVLSLRGSRSIIGRALSNGNKFSNLKNLFFEDFEKKNVLCMVTLYSECSRALTFGAGDRLSALWMPVGTNGCLWAQRV